MIPDKGGPRLEIDENANDSRQNQENHSHETQGQLPILAQVFDIVRRSEGLKPVTISYLEKPRKQGPGECASGPRGQAKTFSGLFRASAVRFGG